MGRYVEGQDRTQSALFPERLDDWIHEDSTVRIIDVCVDELDLSNRGFERAEPAATTARIPVHRNWSGDWSLPLTLVIGEGLSSLQRLHKYFVKRNYFLKLL